MGFPGGINRWAIVAFVFALVLLVNGLLFHRYVTKVTSAIGTADSSTGEDANAEDTARVKSFRASAPEKTGGAGGAGKKSPEEPTLQGALEKCSTDHAVCVEEFVMDVTPEAVYAGGRIDTNISGSGNNRSVLYFVDPTLKPCEYEKWKGEARDDTAYTVMVAGEGSFDEERPSDCVPEV